MPIRGENIGTAYVRIIADGDGLDESIRRSFDDAEPSVRDGAEEHGRVYGDEFDKSVRKSYRGHWQKLQKDLFDESNKALTDSLAKLELSKRFFNSPKWAEFRRRLSDEFGDAGRLAGSELEKQFRDSTNLKAMAREMENIGPRIRRAQETLLREVHSDALEMNAEFDRQLKVTHDAMVQQSRDYDRELEIHWATLARSGAKVQEFGDTNEHSFARIRGYLGKAGDDIDLFSNKIGRAFGKGSRNDFFNIFGSLIGNAVGLLSLVPKAGEKVTGMLERMATGWTNAGGGISGFLAAGGTLVPMLSSLAVGGIAFAVALGALSAVLGPVIALLSGLLGIVTALASTVLLAAAAGVAALVGALLPLGGILLGIGGAMIYFKKHSDALKKTLQPLKADFNDLGKAAGQPIFDALSNNIGRLDSVTRGVTPLMGALGRAVAGLIDDTAKAMQGGQFQRFIQVMTNFLPGAIHQMGDIFRNAFGGLGGLLIGILPLTHQFLDWLQDITGEFDSWANSRAGQREIRAFLRDAAADAKSLLGFLGQVGGLLMDLISNGDTAGAHMFDGMTDALKQFRNYLDGTVTVASHMGGFKDPMGELGKSQVLRGPSPLQTWFSDAQDLGDKLGEIIVSVGDLMRTLDDKHARENLLLILGLLNQIVKVLDVIQFFNPFSLFGKIKDFFARLPRLSDGPNINMAKMITLPNIPALVAHFAGLGGKILAKIGHVNIGGIITGITHAVTSLTSPFVSIGSRVLRLIGHVNVGGIITNVAHAVTSLISPFTGAAGKILAKIFPVNVSGIITGAGSALSKLLGTFSGTAGKILAKVSPVNVSGIITGAAAAANNIVSAFSNVRDRILSLIGGVINIGVNIDWPSPPAWLSKLKLAAGGIVAGPRTALIGESGPEAVVPLNRPLNQVDPAVRWLSAIAQGLTPGGAGAAVTPSGKTVTVGELHVHTPTYDPYAVAVETVNRLAVVGYG